MSSYGKIDGIIRQFSKDLSFTLFLVSCSTAMPNEDFYILDNNEINTSLDGRTFYYPSLSEDGQNEGKAVIRFKNGRYDLQDFLYRITGHYFIRDKKYCLMPEGQNTTSCFTLFKDKNGNLLFASHIDSVKTPLAINRE